MKKLDQTLIFLLILTLGTSCKNGKNIYISKQDAFYGEIESSFSELKTDSVGLVNQPPTVEVSQLALAPNDQFLLAADRVHNAILLFNRRGTKLLSKVGGKGRGPGEFHNISQLSVSYNNNLYVLDILLKRITKFKIENNQLHYQTTISLKPPPHSSLQDVYVTKYGTFGVYQRIDDYKTFKESYHLYKLDKKFKRIEHLLDMPGNAKVKLANHLYIPGLLSKMTYWSLDGQWFYYIQSNNTKIHTYNIRTGKQDTKQYFNFKDRLNTTQKTDFFKYEDKSMIKRFPKAGKAIEKAKVIPFFDYFLAKDHHLFFGIFYPHGQGGKIICVNQTTGKTQYIKTSSNFWHFAVGKHDLYAIISMPNGKNRVKIVKLNS